MRNIDGVCVRGEVSSSAVAAGLLSILFRIPRSSLLPVCRSARKREVGQRMRGCRRSWDLADDGSEQLLTHHCTCATGGTTEDLDFTGWISRPVTTPWSAHVTATSSGDTALLAHHKPSSCRQNHSGTKLDHARTTSSIQNHPRTTDYNCTTTVTTMCKRKPSKPTTYHSKQNRSLQTAKKTSLKLSTSCRQSVPKPTHSIHRDLPDIPFNMGQLHSNPRYGESLVHTELYLSCYTYPQLEHRLGESLSPEVCLACGGASDWASTGEGIGGRRRRRREGEAKVRPSVIQVLVEEPVLRSSHHSHPPPQV